MESLHDIYLKMFGADGHPTQLTLLQIALRGLIIFAAGLTMVRLGDRRSLSEKTAFDAIFIVLLGSMLSRAINGTAPFLLTIGGAITLMIIHRVCAWFAYRSHSFGKLIKGEEVALVRNGKVDWDAMKSALVSKHDLAEDLRLSAKTENLEDIRLAQLERSGDISFISKEKS
ncbi:MAG: hypothetical protein QOG48_933 [Verrucomicrobiota bacterium]|jgi:uncharacterized membrane protein YcaP (DUF421 family)